MNELNIQSLSDFVLNATILWNRGLDAVPQFARNSGIVKEVPVPMNSGNTRKFSEIDLEEYAKKKKESDQSARARVQQGYTKEATLYRVSLNIGISYEMRTQGKYLDIQQKLTNLGAVVPNRMDLDLTHRFTFFSSTTYTDMDGETVDISVGDTLALGSTAHTLRGSSTTFRNILANNPQFSRGSLEAMELMRIENTFNQFGEKMSIKDDVIFCGDDPNTNNAIDEVLKSSAKVDAPNDGVTNVYQGKYTKKVFPRLSTDALGGVDTTKRKYWGVASTVMSTFYLGVHEEAHMIAPPASGNNGEDPQTDDWNFGTRGGYMICIPSATWAGFSKGDGTA